MARRRYDEVRLFELICRICGAGIDVFPRLAGAVAVHFASDQHRKARAAKRAKAA